MKRRFLNLTMVFLMFSLMVCAGCQTPKKVSVLGPGDAVAVAQPNKEQPQVTAQAESEPQKKEVEKLEKIEAETQEALKDKEQEITKIVTAEAQQAIAEQKAGEKLVQLKEQAVVLAQQEAEVLKKEAEVTKDVQLLKQAKQRAADVKQLSKEASVEKEKFEVIKSKTQFTQEKLSAQQEEKENLEKLLEDVKREKAAKRSWIEKSFEAGVIVFIGLVLLFILKFGLKRFEKLVTKKDVLREDATTLRLKTISKLLHWLGTVVLLLVLAYMVLETFGFNVAPLIAGAGIAGLAFGFGGQYLIRDLINGLFIMIEGQYGVNDVVKINDHGGLVEDINLRITTLRDLEGRVIIIPNGEIKEVVNYTREYAHALFDIGVAYKEDVDRVMEVIKQVGRQMKEDSYFRRLILDDLEMFGVDAFGDSQVTIKFRIKTLPIKQWEVAREFRRRLKKRFDELGIEIPFPHRTLYWGAGQENDWLREFANRKHPEKPS